MAKANRDAASGRYLRAASEEVNIEDNQKDRSPERVPEPGCLLDMISARKNARQRG